MDTLDAKVNKEELETRVKEVYRDVAEKPEAEYHFEMGRGLAEKLGYPKEDLDAIPAEAIKSFAGVGYHFDLADMKAGERVLDLGSGSGTDIFVAALKVGSTGAVIGVDMTDKQIDAIFYQYTKPVSYICMVSYFVARMECARMEAVWLWTTSGASA